MTDHTHETNETNETSPAKAIMQDPAAASGTDNVTPIRPPVLSSPHVKDKETATLLDNLPGLVGALDQAIKDTTGKQFPFVFLVFTPGMALSAGNVNDQETVHALLREFINHVDKGGASTPDLGAANDVG